MYIVYIYVLFVFSYRSQIFIGENVILFILFPMKDMPIFVILFKITIFDSTN